MKYLLLDHLAQHMNADYVSELKDKRWITPYKEYIAMIPEEMFSLDDWRDTCAYLCGIKEDIETVQQAKQYILDWLNS